MSRTYRVSLRGAASYQDAIDASRGGERVDLMHEPTNRHDKRAVVAITEYGQIIGYLPKGGWLTEAIVDEDQIARAKIADISTGEATGGVSVVVLEVELGAPTAE